MPSSRKLSSAVCWTIEEKRVYTITIIIESDAGPILTSMERFDRVNEIAVRDAARELCDDAVDTFFAARPPEPTCIIKSQ